MSEKIIYEMGLTGAGSVISQINSVSAALANVRADGFVGLNRTIGETIKNLTGLAAVSKQVQTLQTPFTRRGTNAAIDQGLVPNFNLKDVDLTHFAKTVTELREFRKRISAFNRNIVEGMFTSGKQPLLGYDPWKPSQSDAYWYGGIGAAVNDIRERHQMAEAIRAEMRRKWRDSSPWSDLGPYDIVPVGERSVSATAGQTTALATLDRKYGIVDTGRVTDPGYIDAEWRDIRGDGRSRRKPYEPSFGEWIRWAAKNSNSPYGFFKMMSFGNGAAGLVGKLGLWTMAFNVVTSGLAWFGRNIKRVADSVKAFGDVILQATSSWRQMRESYAYGTSMGSLAGQWARSWMLGGDAASASALWGRLSAERAMLGFGGKGGPAMEAARLFGVNIRGSGEYGYATNDEFMRSVVKTMTTLTPESRRALANVLKLDPREFWAVSHGEAYYDYLTNRKTLLGTIRGFMFGDDVGKEIFSGASTTASRQFTESWGDFMVSLKELGGVLGEAILPALTMFIDLLSTLTGILSAVIKPIAWVLNKFFNLINPRFFMSEVAMSDVPTSGQVQARVAGITANGQYGYGNVTLNVGDISLNSLGLDDDATNEQIRERVTSVLFDQLGDHLINNRK